MDPEEEMTIETPPPKKISCPPVVRFRFSAVIYKDGKYAAIISDDMESLEYYWNWISQKPINLDRLQQVRISKR